MARESSITFEQVASTANSIKAEGGKPTARNIREALGTGSMATVLRFFQQWQSGQTRQSQAIDDTIDPAISRAISNQIAIKVAEATADATARLADLQAAADTIIAENEQQAAEIKAQAAELAAMQEQNAELTGRYQQSEIDAARTATELAAERQAAEASRMELAKSLLKLEAMPRLEGDLNAARAELKDTDRQRQAAERELAGAMARIDGFENMKSEHVRELAGAEAQSARAIQKLETQLQEHKLGSKERIERMEASRQQVDAELSEARKEAKETAAQIGKLEGAIEALKEQIKAGKETKVDKQGGRNFGAA